MTTTKGLTRTERVADSDIRFKRRGTGDTALVFVHGFLDDQYVWDAVIDAMAVPGFEYVQLDLAGSGDRTSAGGPFDLTRFAHDVGAVVDALDKPVILVAQSMGTLVAELVAVDHGEHTRGLVLLSPVPLAGVGLPEEAAQQFRSMGGNAEGQRVIRQQLSVSLPEAELDRLVVVGTRVPEEVVRDLVKCWNEGHPRGRDASLYRGPVLVGRGAEDGFVTDEMITTHVLPRFEWPESFAVRDAGHWAHVEAAAAVAVHIEAFLTTLPLEASEGSDPSAASGSSEGPGSGWRGAFASKTPEDFAAAFAEDIVLEASVLAIPVKGRDQVKATMTQASLIYESLEFVREAVAGSRTYLEWEATAFGGREIFGVTVLTKGADGRINHVAIHHRPLEAALRFSIEMRERLDGTIDRSHFYTAD
ncbi:alpha/beta fold hydrolase [Streptomyces sp. NPDC059837]|jgi:pimeloyl-ACP methyl ester carboxylesterase|uniref:alpha/beta fold hydrolase n=1 Tax=unclassified Streptomyces TaxID=2593676 RepID=UPI002257A963|nr:MULTISPECIES: alpha/beta fold hydrolase [unclassified Streptomyces]MCX5096885.1 alpha/beta fold hydrolase [Streptomyces sp. NBC_00365]MCX5191204.1 alpha/beta fold hydrolase [Streptomyces sp. NBC_00268]